MGGNRGLNLALKILVTVSSSSRLNRTKRPNVSVEDPQTVFQAVSWYEAGLDFADALHLASSMQADKCRLVK